MLYRPYGKTGLEISVIGLGGHEFRNDGSIKGMDQQELWRQGGHIFPDFGGPDREALVKRALDSGINFFDVTIDTEKEALGRVLKRLHPSQELFIQTRPDNMVYSYDPENRRLANYALLKEEIVRILSLLQRDRVDIFNFAFLQSALDADPDYLAKIDANIRRLKDEGLIRFAAADTFSGNETYLRQIETGSFDSIFINYNLNSPSVEERVLPKVQEMGMAFLSREVFMKGQLFPIATAADITDHHHVARAAIKWVLRHKGVTSVVVGMSSIAQLENNLGVLDDLTLSPDDQAIMRKIAEALHAPKAA